MQKIVMGISAIAVGALACHPPSQGAAASPSPASAVATTPCNASVPGVDISSWQTISAPGFTFCVPERWTRVGNSIRNVSGNVDWGTGNAPVKTATTVIRVPAGGVPDVGDQMPGGSVNRFSEEIGGKAAELYRNQFGAKYFTGAAWVAPRVWLQGAAKDGSTADIEITIYRSVRFTIP